MGGWRCSPLPLPTAFPSPPRPARARLPQSLSEAAAKFEALSGLSPDSDSAAAPDSAVAPDAPSSPAAEHPVHGGADPSTLGSEALRNAATCYDMVARARIGQVGQCLRPTPPLP